MRILRMAIILCLLLFVLLAGCGQKPAEQPESTETTPAEATASIPIETVTIDGFSMNYFRFGQGEKTFVMLPGLSAQGVMGSAEQITDAYAMMTDDFTVYVFDPRNELPGSYSVSEMAEDMAKVLPSLGLGPVYVMGASMGGMVALELAVHHPELIEKIVLASSAVQMKDEQFQTLDRWIRLAREGDAEALYLDFGKSIYPEEIFEQSRDALVEASKTVTENNLNRFVILAESMRGFDVADDMDKIECPILAINDKEDHVLGEEAVKTMEQTMSRREDGEFYLYDGYGHAVYDTAPDFKERMLQFFMK